MFLGRFLGLTSIFAGHVHHIPRGSKYPIFTLVPKTVDGTRFEPETSDIAYRDPLEDEVKKRLDGLHKKRVCVYVCVYIYI